MTTEQTAQAEQFKTEAVAYAKTAYDAARCKCDLKDPARTFADAMAEGEQFSLLDGDSNWKIHNDARCNILELLRYLKNW